MRKHWTQTREGKAKLSRSIKRALRRKRIGAKQAEQPVRRPSSSLVTLEITMYRSELPKLIDSVLQLDRVEMFVKA